MTPDVVAEEIERLCRAAKEASRKLGILTAVDLNRGLLAVAAALEDRKATIQEANARDVQEAEARGTSAPLVHRLRLTDAVFSQMVEGVRQIAALPCPLGEVIRAWTRPNGLRLRKVRTPIGVIGIIYESRPNVTVDAAVLCLKAGNAVVLRGGSEASNSNRALAEALRIGLRDAGLPMAVQMCGTTDRSAVAHLCRQDAYLDLMIPRGGESLIRTVVAEARMPVIKHYNGICHAYVHESGDPDMAEKIVINGKCQKPGVCNAIETLLIDAVIAPKVLPRILQALADRGVELRGDEAAQAIGGQLMVPATEADWTTEYLDLILSVRVVDDLDAAIDHINRYGSHHSDAIVASDASAAGRFLLEVDSAAVFWNASPRFNDGYEFGFGAEIGISTDKLHARGPMGLEELTSYKYLVEGTGQVRG